MTHMSHTTIQIMMWPVLRVWFRNGRIDRQVLSVMCLVCVGLWSGCNRNEPIEMHLAVQHESTATGSIEHLVLFGPQRVDRREGGPTDVTFGFEMPQDGLARIVVDNVGVSAAWIYLSDELAIAPDRFSSSATVIEEVLPLSGGHHTLRVRVSSAPGTYLQIRIEWVGGCPDPDADGLCDEDDNCPAVANPGQEDTDADSVGDGCDPCANESEGDFCARLGAECGALTALDNCQATRTAACGTCLSPDTCAGAGTPNVCGCTAADPGDVCAANNAECGDLFWVDSCGSSDTANCGTCEGGFEQGPGPTITGGFWHSCGIMANQVVTCWGGNWDGQSTPPMGAFKQISAGLSHTCGLGVDGTVSCWGNGDYGKLLPPSGVFTQISAGQQHTCAVTDNKSVVCWGDNRDGQSSAPTGIFTQVAAGGRNTCALRRDGTVVCWGDNVVGESTPPTGSTFIQISVGEEISCGLHTSGSVECWGGEGPWGIADVPTSVFARISVGGHLACGLRADGTAECWGDGTAVPPPGEYSQVQASWGHHVCGIVTNGTAICWGGPNNAGQATAPPGTLLSCRENRCESRQ